MKGGFLIDDKRDENKTPSLKQLQVNFEALKRKIQDDESSHEFYIALWKSAPYAIVALIPAVMYTYLVDSAYAIGPLIAFAVVSLIGFYGWYTQRELNKDIAKTSISIEETQKRLQRQIMKVEAQFVHCRPGTQLYDFNNWRLDESIVVHEPVSISHYVHPQMLKDMEVWDSDLLQMLVKFDEASQLMFPKLLTFYQEASKKLKMYDKICGVQSGQPVSRQPAFLLGSYLVLSGEVSSLSDVVPRPYREVRVNIGGESVHFIELLLGKEDPQNPYPGMLRENQLVDWAKDLKKSRLELERLHALIDYIITVKYEVPASFGQFGIR